MGDGPKPGAPVHGRPVVVAAAQARFSRMDGHPDLQREGIGPGFTREGGLQRTGGGNRVAGEIEYGKERIALSSTLEQNAAKLLNQRCGDLIVPCQCHPHGFGVLLPEASGAFDIGKVEGDGSGRQVHVLIPTERQ